MSLYMRVKHFRAVGGGDEHQVLLQAQEKWIFDLKGRAFWRKMVDI